MAKNPKLKPMPHNHTHPKIELIALYYFLGFSDSMFQVDNTSCISFNEQMA